MKVLQIQDKTSNLEGHYKIVKPSKRNEILTRRKNIEITVHKTEILSYLYYSVINGLKECNITPQDSKA